MYILVAIGLPPTQDLYGEQVDCGDPFGTMVDEDRGCLLVEGETVLWVDEVMCVL